MTWGTIWTILSILDALLVGAAIVVVLRRPREPLAMLAWIFALVFLPVLGLVLFLMLGEPRFRRARKRRRRRRRRRHPIIAKQLDALARRKAEQPPPPVDPRLAHLMAFSTRVGQQAPTFGNKVTIFHEQEKCFDDLMEAVRAAQSHVHLEYYIFQPDETGHALRDLLVKKAADGVHCRLLVDYIGCWNWPRSFRQSFKNGGVETAYFLPVVPWRGRWRVNFRNHRKIAVIDGMVGFTGSMNIGDEYRGRRVRCGPWRDTHIRVEGAAVHQLQEVFIDDWVYATRRELIEEECFPQPPTTGEHIVQVIPSGPDTSSNILHHLLLAATSAARKSVTMLTPYFAPDTTMLLALQSAAYRGARVQLLVPTCTDSRVTLWAGRSFYQQLVEAGVEIYEYDAGMLHSKVVVVDDAWAMVGSANMDQRSFRINYEITTMIYDSQLATELHADFESLRYHSRRVEPTGPSDWTFKESLKLGLARLVSPLL